jgi:hypothetical protein
MLTQNNLPDRGKRGKRRESQLTRFSHSGYNRSAP